MKNTKQEKSGHPNIECMLCKKNHPAHRCLETRNVRDNKRSVPSDFCYKHCGKKSENCKNCRCHLYTVSGKIMNLLCGKTDHGSKHILLCGMEGCRKASEKYWDKLAERKVIINFTPSEDVDLVNEQIDINVEELDEKLMAADVQSMQTLFIPIMLVGNEDTNDPQPREPIS